MYHHSSFIPLLPFIHSSFFIHSFILPSILYAITQPCVHFGTKPSGLLRFGTFLDNDAYLLLHPSSLPFSMQLPNLVHFGTSLSLLRFGTFLDNDACLLLPPSSPFILYAITQPCVHFGTKASALLRFRTCLDHDACFLLPFTSLSLSCLVYLSLWHSCRAHYPT